jgi:hypothetical protein
MLLSAIRQQVRCCVAHVRACVFACCLTQQFTCTCPKVPSITCRQLFSTTIGNQTDTRQSQDIHGYDGPVVLCVRCSLLAHWRASKHEQNMVQQLCTVRSFLRQASVGSPVLGVVSAPATAQGRATRSLVGCATCSSQAPQHSWCPNHTRHAAAQVECGSREHLRGQALPSEQFLMGVTGTADQWPGCGRP